MIKNHFPRISPVKLLVAATVLAVTAVSVHAESRRTVVRGEASGPTAVLIVPAPSHENAIGIAQQVATVPLERGALMILETDGAPAREDVSALLREVGAAGEHRPDWVWFYQGTAREDSAGGDLEKPTLLLHASSHDRWIGLAGAAFATEAALDPASRDQTSAHAKQGVIGYTFPHGTPLSRQVRHAREFTFALLRDAGMAPRGVSFDWARLRDLHPTLIALYDAEGIGGGGPANMERIVFTQMPDTGVFRVSGEDIRDGALAAAHGSIFPGGSGRGIGNGLQAEGREILRDFIAAGGGYAGICAGAYFAASGLDNYLHAIDLQHSQPWARGRGMIEIELTPEGQAFFGTDKTVWPTRYANGPVFLPTDQEGEGDPDYKVLATFKTPSTDRSGTVREEMVGEGAIGIKQFGEGRILIISPHPESHEEYDPAMARGLRWTLPREAEQPARAGNS